MSFSISNKKCATLLLCSIRSSATETIKTESLNFISRFMNDKFFPNLKPGATAINSSSWHWLGAPILVSISSLFFILSIACTIGYVYLYNTCSNKKLTPKDEIYEEISFVFFVSSIISTISGILFLGTNYFCPGILYTRIFNSLPINLYFLFFLNLAMGVFIFFCFIIICISILNSKNISKGLRLPIFAGFAGALVTGLLFTLCFSFIGTASILYCFIALSIAIPLITMALITIISNRYFS